ncbi:MAG: T9SS type A sorting domain-containing protein [Flavobacteriales bacterium]|nr:T9SS type A sorting domain-containing protein [Flavobacteriales bacterium]
MKHLNSSIVSILAIALLIVFSFTTVKSQTNTYASVASVSGKVVSLNAGHSGTFIVGNQALIIQMKGASISETNNSDYGAVTAYNNAGAYEIATIEAINGDDITLCINVDAYDVNSNVQLISIAADDGSGNYQEDGSNTPPAWDGYTGGVYAMKVCGTYTLNGNLTSSGGGFRGGIPNGTGTYYGSLTQQWAATDVNDNDFSGFKGEGIASTFCNTTDLGEGVNLNVLTGTSSGGWAYNYVSINMGTPGTLCSVNDLGSGAIANGGGAGTNSLGGGAGGGNGGVGGDGGCGWASNYDPICAMGSACVGCVKEDVQGLGGLATGGTGSILHLGGGGGGPYTFNAQITEGDGYKSQGTAGGVIYIIVAEIVEGNGNTITSNGEDNTFLAEWIANGGGGAGGTIYIESTSANNLTLSAVGGDGGDVYFEDYGCFDLDGETGPGGGGGGGVIIAPSGVTTNVAGGLAGVYWDETQYGSRAAGTNWCADNGAAGVVATSSLSIAVPKCLITEIKAFECGDLCGIGGAADQTGADLEVQVFLSLCSTAPLSVDWSNGSSASGIADFGTDAENNLCVGTHTVTVTDANALTNTCEFIVVAPDSPVVSIDAVVDASCAGGNDGEIDGSATGGTSPYTYNWGSLGTTASVTVVTAGTYTLTVTDDNSCTNTASATVTEPSGITIVEDNYINETCDGFCDGAIDLSVSGGVFNDVVTPTTFTDNVGGTIVNLSTTDFTISVSGITQALVDEATIVSVCMDLSIVPRDKIESVELQLTNPCGSTIILKSATNPAGTNFTDVCFTSDAAANITTGTSPFTGDWLPEGELLDAVGGTLTGCDPNGNWLLSMVNSEMNDGVLDSWSITINDIAPNSATPSLIWEGSSAFSSTADDIASLCTGTYTVTASDDDGCSITYEREITTVPNVYAQITVVADQCFYSGTNSFNFNSEGGSTGAGYTFLWDFDGGTGGNTSAENPTGVTYAACGDYTVTLTVTDNSTGCVVSDTQDFTVSCDITATLVATDPLCFEQCDGSIAMTAADGEGSGMFAYAWDGQNTGFSSNSEDPTGLCADTYDITVTDATFCSAIFQTVVSDPTVLTASYVTTDETCNTNNDGTASLSFSGGTENYSVNWDTEGVQSGITAATGISNISGLGGTAGGQAYSVTLTDANGCSLTFTDDVFEPTLVTVAITDFNDPTCFGNSNGSIEATFSGGISNYTVGWPSTNVNNLAAGTYTENSLSDGTYTITVTDANGCSETATRTLTDPSQLDVAATGTDALCYGVSTGTLSSVASGGTGAYIYVWTNSGGAYNTGASVTSVPADSYTVVVTDANACTDSDEYLITEPTELISNPFGMDATCNAATDGTAIQGTSGGTPVYTYAWSNGDNGTAAFALGIGTYTVTVTDNNNCTASGSTTVTEPTELTVSVSTTPDAGVGGTATVTASGGTTSYSYVWNNLESTAAITDLNAANYCVTVTDANACTVSACEDVDFTVSIRETNKDDLIRVNRNTITVVSKGGDLEIYSLTGQRVHQSTVNAGEYSINVGKGIYLVRFRTNEKQITKKVYIANE